MATVSHLVQPPPHSSCTQNKYPIIFWGWICSQSQLPCLWLHTRSLHAYYYVHPSHSRMEHWDIGHGASEERFKWNKQETYLYLSQRQIIYLCVFQMKIYYYVTKDHGQEAEEDVKVDDEDATSECKLLSRDKIVGCFCRDNERILFVCVFNKYTANSPAFDYVLFWTTTTTTTAARPGGNLCTRNGHRAWNSLIGWTRIEFGLASGFTTHGILVSFITSSQQTANSGGGTRNSTLRRRRSVPLLF